jgi:hypothetical protein
MSARLNVTEGLRLLAMRVGRSVAQISKELGYKTPASLVNMITRGSIRMKVGAAMAEACGYKMVLIPKDIDIEDGIEIKGEVEIE